MLVILNSNGANSAGVTEPRRRRKPPQFGRATFQSSEGAIDVPYLYRSVRACKSRQAGNRRLLPPIKLFRSFGA